MVDQGWKPGIDKQESIIFYRYNPNQAKKWEGRKPGFFTNHTQESENIVDENGEIIKYAYDVAYERRDKTIR